MSKTELDWEAIEFQYRAGVLSLREIAALHPGSNHVAITRRAKKEGWARDLSAKIKAKANDLVTRRAVTQAETERRAVTEREVIDANAERIAQVRGEHRGDISRARALCMNLLAELEAQTTDVPALAALGEMLRAPDEKGADKLNDIYRAVISLPERTKTMKALAESLKVLIGLEREAYGIGESDKPAPNSGAEFWRELVEHLPD